MFGIVCCSDFSEPAPPAAPDDTPSPEFKGIFTIVGEPSSNSRLSAVFNIFFLLTGVTFSALPTLTKLAPVISGSSLVSPSTLEPSPSFFSTPVILSDKSDAVPPTIIDPRRPKIPPRIPPTKVPGGPPTKVPIKPPIFIPPANPTPLPTILDTAPLVA